MIWKVPFALVSTVSVVVLAAAGEAVGGSGSDSPLAPGANLGRFTAQTCVQCHEVTTELDHPVGIPIRDSGELPLGSGKRLDCLTCHDDQATDPAHSLRLAGGGGGLLRQSPRKLCQNCHTQPGDSASRLSHGLAMGKAHLGFAKDAGSGIGLDHETRNCLSCHDGTTASSSGVRDTHLPNVLARSAQSIRDMHPIGVRYDWTPKPHMAPQYRHERELPKAIRLFQGKLGCGSCHSTYSRQELMLARDPKKQELCLDCHIK